MKTRYEGVYEPKRQALVHDNLENLAESMLAEGRSLEEVCKLIGELLYDSGYEDPYTPESNDSEPTIPCGANK